MDMRWSADLKEIPDLSKAINLEKLNLRGCTSLVTLPSSIQNLNKLRVLSMKGCSKLKVLPADVNLKSLESLDLRGCSKLKKFPRISRNISELFLSENAIEGEEDCFWIENLSHLVDLYWYGVPMRCMPTNFHPEYLTELEMSSSRLEKLWGGVQSLGSLAGMVLSGCESLKEIPDLSKATNLKLMELDNCKSLVMLPSSIRNLKNLTILSMKGCIMLEVLPTDVNLVSLCDLDLRGCSKLRIFPQISTRIENLYLDDTAIEEVSSWIEKMGHLAKLTMTRCKKLKNVSPNILKKIRINADFSDCGGITTMHDQLPTTITSQIVEEVIPYHLSSGMPNFNNCFNLDRDAQEFILQSVFLCAVLPGGEVPTYFTYRACGSSLTIPLSESSFSLKACIVIGPPTHPEDRHADIGVRWFFSRQKRHNSFLQ
ncbi:protein SUPPRESSOR OF npr1-1, CONSTITUTIVE 1 isoform X1 [Eutrema salsugineum]|uniref:protein SUPPRESSOR OF npr1-1, CONSTITUTIVE 1 isoform X1 n=1 Tax=Eutrema salsugineum TaxID=72664 RepID=UPI000CECEC92|nr:protein SUPPRESSOR OF npr1-1, CONSTITUTIVE 1 isoform X1 [Eutrema salsugineum]